MKTIVLKIKTGYANREKIRKASKIILRGGLVAFPTETVYGLGANALSAMAVKKIFRAKKRPLDDPLIVHIAEIRQAYALAKKVPLEARLLMQEFWPGPLTIVLQKSWRVPKATTGSLKTVAIRMPKNRVALELIRDSGVPIAAPSANLFGRPSPTSARHVLDDLGGKIDAVIDSGKTNIGVESTVLDLSGKKPVLLRPGKVSKEEIEGTIGKISVHKLALGKKRKTGKTASPGMGYRHYAPDSEVILVAGKYSAARKKAIALAQKISEGKKTALLLHKKPRAKEVQQGHGKIRVVAVGGPEKAAKKIYSVFRRLEKSGFEAIIVQGFPEKGMGFALMNRLQRAAERVVKT